MNWRHWNNALHRDLGCLCFGLTIVYVISGLAMNHAERWNPSYRVEHLHSRLDGPFPAATLDQSFINNLLARLGESRPYMNSFRPDHQTLQIFVEGNTITVNLGTGEIRQEKVMPRPLLSQVNFLQIGRAHV